MFRKIKKWYFKIYHLFKLLSVFILIFGLCNKVYAEEKYYCSKSVNKIITGNFVQGYINPFGTAQPTNWWSITYNGVIEVKENTSYSFKLMKAPPYYNPQRITFMFYNKNKEYINYNDSIASNGNYFRNITTPTGTKYIILGLYNVSEQRANSITSVLYEGDDYKTSKSITEPIINYEQCDVQEPENENEVYSSFLTLYTDKISYLANGFTSNPYLLTMIGIIFSFVVLELFLKILHLKGGKYR